MNKNYPYYKHECIHNMQELLISSLNRGENDIAFSYFDKTIIKKTYKDFYLDVINIKKYLAKYYSKEHIAIVAPNSYCWLVFFCGIILSGNIAVIIDKDLNEDKIDDLLRKSDTKVVVHSKSENIFKKKGLKTLLIEKIQEYISIGEETKDKKLKPLDYAVIFFTSGTTGANKAVMLSEENITDNIYGACSIFLLSGPTVSVLPFHHSFGLIIGAIAPFFYHYPVFLNESLKYLMRDIKICKPETLIVVPAFVEQIYKQINNQIKKEKKKYVFKIGTKVSNFFLKRHIDIRRKLFKKILYALGGNLQYIICGGAFLNQRYVSFMRDIGIEVLNGYGITECSPVVAVNRNSYMRDGSVGQLIKGAEVKIEDGEILVKSKSVMKGYYKDKKATKLVLKDGWFYTGDLGYIDEDGFLFITGRKKNLIILNNGENILPEALEEELLKDEAVCEVVVAEKDKKIVAYIYPSEEYINNQEYFDKLIYNYNRGVAKNRQIAEAILRDTEFIKNNNRKILRDKI